MTISFFEDADNSGFQKGESFEISGTYNGTAAVEVCVTLNGAPVTAWANAVCDSASKTFKASIMAPAGGLYKKTARYIGTSTVYNSTGSFYVGHVIVVAPSQSQGTFWHLPGAGPIALNSGVKATFLGRFDMPNDLALGNTFPSPGTWAETWQTPTGYGAVSLINRLATYTTDPIILMNFAKGNTMMAEWQYPYNQVCLSYAFAMLGRYAKRAKTWICNIGEKDAWNATTQADYIGAFNTVHGEIQRFMKMGPCGFKFFICKTGTFYPTGTSPIPSSSQLTTIRNAQDAIVAANTNCVMGPDTGNYTTLDGLHLSADATGTGAFCTALADIIGPTLT